MYELVHLEFKTLTSSVCRVRIEYNTIAFKNNNAIAKRQTCVAI